ncbi:MAG: hypothetical protein A2V75_03195 [Actinobacteria bacterium RBG_16_70_17]|nr:MAG: hypothetical protein A2V75_03195 [Actinobacteria bacterium RBG_16_70_17]
MSLRGSEGSPASLLRRALAESLLSSVLSLGTWDPPPWRLEPCPAPAAVLMVGEPTPSLAYRAAGVPR